MVRKKISNLTVINPKFIVSAQLSLRRQIRLPTNYMISDLHPVNTAERDLVMVHFISQKHKIGFIVCSI